MTSSASIVVKRVPGLRSGGVVRRSESGACIFPAETGVKECAGGLYSTVTLFARLRLGAFATLRHVTPPAVAVHPRSASRY